LSDLLLVNADEPERRVALVENGLLAELHIERTSDRRIVGNIYKGRVARVLPGMQAAFVDIGIGKSAFLYADDVHALEEESDPRPPTGGTQQELPSTSTIGTIPIQQQLAEGDEVIVQVAKEPIGTKGARVTSFISLPGRTLVFMPTVDHVGISRRITDEVERQRLRLLLDTMRPAGTGFIVRTVGEGQSDDTLRSEMSFLVKLWDDVRARADVAKPPCMVHQDLDLTLRAVRDLASSRVRRIIVDDTAEYERLTHFIDNFMPRYADVLELYQGTEPLFDAHGIEHEIDRALDRKVWLKSGGYLVIDESEALTAIDVNTGRYVGQRTLEDTTSPRLTSRP
jgi:ribonuclease G